MKCLISNIKNFFKTTSQKHKKALRKLKTLISIESKKIAELINLDDRIECIARTPVFITHKDHKASFQKIHRAD